MTQMRKARPTRVKTKAKEERRGMSDEMEKGRHENTANAESASARTGSSRQHETGGGARATILNAAIPRRRDLQYLDQVSMPVNFTGLGTGSAVSLWVHVKLTKAHKDSSPSILQNG